MQIILNLTQHNATPAQIEAGVIEPTNKQAIQNQLTFDKMPDKRTVALQAGNLAYLAMHELMKYYNNYKFTESYQEHAYELAKLGLTDVLFSVMHPKVMIGGAPYLMAPLEQALKDRGITPVYAYSERVSEEQIQEDGSVRKVNVFKHKGFVEA